jgi:hypothetical protein
MAGWVHPHPLTHAQSHFSEYGTKHRIGFSSMRGIVQQSVFCDMVAGRLGGEQKIKAGSIKMDYKK